MVQQRSELLTKSHMQEPELCLKNLKYELVIYRRSAG